MKKWLVVGLGLLVPVIAYASTASRLGVYTTDNVPALTFGYVDQFGNANGGSIILKGSTSGTVTLQPSAIAGATVITLPSGTGTLYPSALATSTTQTSLASTTTLAAITGLSVPVAAAGTYNCNAKLFTTTADPAAGAKVAFAGASGMTATSAEYSVALNNTTTAAAVTTALSDTTTFGAALGATTTVNDIEMRGSVVVNAAGNLVVQGAQNVSQSGATVFLANSHLNCFRSN